MQVIAEFLTAFMVWLAAAVLSQFGVEVDFKQHTPPSVERVIERKASEAPRVVSDACPETAPKPVRGQIEAV